MLRLSPLWVAELLHFPLLDARRPVRLERHLQAEAAGRDRFEGNAVIAVLFDAVGLRGLDRFPGLAVAVEEAPGLRDAALAAAGVVEPVDFSFGDLRRG